MHADATTLYQLEIPKKLPALGFAMPDDDFKSARVKFHGGDQQSISMKRFYLLVSILALIAFIISSTVRYLNEIATANNTRDDRIARWLNGRVPKAKQGRDGIFLFSIFGSGGSVLHEIG
jgi:hypothetical protein